MPDDGALIKRLADLVAFDTQNPTGNERPMIDKLSADLTAVGAHTVETFETSGHHAVYARFGAGTPRLLLNAHVDTVPANTGYSHPPHTLVERNGRLYGLGAADTKGAIAAIVEALAMKAAATPGGQVETSVAVLFSGDEERTNSCAKAFVASPRAEGLTRAIVCEPTALRVGHRHRGIGAVEAVATSPGGHSSRADELPSPVAALARAAVALDEMGKRHRKSGPDGFQGLCLNVAGIAGGVAFNVIPSRATLSMSLRPPPGVDVRAVLDEAEREARKAAAPDALDWSVVIASQPFETRNLAAFADLLGDRVREPVNLAFWTEAAMFSARGIDAVVFGPGHIEEAHAADEFVDLADLVAARDAFLRMLS